MYGDATDQSDLRFAMRLLSELLSNGRFEDISIDKVIELLSGHIPQEKLESMTKEDLYEAIERLLRTGESTESNP